MKSSDYAAAQKELKLSGGDGSPSDADDEEEEAPEDDSEGEADEGDEKDEGGKGGDYRECAEDFAAAFPANSRPDVSKIEEALERLFEKYGK